MVNFNGKYVLEKNDHFVDYLKTLGRGIPESVAQKVDSFKTVITVTVDGNSYTLNNNNGSPDTTTTIKFDANQTFDEDLLTGNKVKTTAIVDDKSIVLKSIDADGHTGERIYEFTDSGLTIFYKAPDSTEIIAKRYFKKT